LGCNASRGRADEGAAKSKKHLFWYSFLWGVYFSCCFHSENSNSHLQRCCHAKPQTPPPQWDSRSQLVLHTAARSVEKLPSPRSHTSAHPTTPAGTPGGGSVITPCEAPLRRNSSCVLECRIAVTKSPRPKGAPYATPCPGGGAAVWYAPDAR
jgi:hypothetical protein